MKKLLVLLLISFLQPSLIICCSETKDDAAEVKPLEPVHPDDHMAIIAALMANPTKSDDRVREKLGSMLISKKGGGATRDKSSKKYTPYIFPKARSEIQTSCTLFTLNRRDKKADVEYIPIVRSKPVGTFTTYTTENPDSLSSDTTLIEITHHESGKRSLLQKSAYSCITSILLSPQDQLPFAYSIIFTSKGHRRVEVHGRSFMNSPYPDHDILLAACNTTGDPKEQTVKIWKIPQNK